MKLEIRLFRFDARHDYLPFYQPFRFDAADGATLGDLLAQHRRNDPLFLFDAAQAPVICVNGVAADLRTPLFSLAQKLGRDLTLEPLATDRAVLNLQIDTADFDERFALFAELTDESDRAYYRSFQSAYYRSAMRKLAAGYLGEGVFMLAARLLEKKPDQAERILKLIAGADNGVFLYPGMGSLLFEGAETVNQTVLSLQQRIVEAKLAPKGARAGVAFDPQNAGSLGHLAGEKVAVLTDSGPFGPHVEAAAHEAALKNAGAQVIRLDNPRRFSGAGVAATAPGTARKAAAGLLLEAMDRGATHLVCACDGVARFLAAEFKAIEREARQPVQIRITTLASANQKAA